MKHETMCLDFLTCTCETIKANKLRDINRMSFPMVEREPCKGCGDRWRHDLRDKYVCNTCGDIETKEIAA